MPSAQNRAYTLLIFFSCLVWVHLFPDVSSIFPRLASVRHGGGRGQLPKSQAGAVQCRMIYSRAACAAIVLVVVLTVLTSLLFPAMQGPYSVVHGPATEFRALRLAAIAHASILHGAMHSIRGSYPSAPLVVSRLKVSEIIPDSEAMPDCSTILRC